MAFASTIKQQFVIGDRVCHIGTYVSDGGDTGGDIVTGLREVHSIVLQPQGTAVADAPVVNEAISTAGTVGGAVTIVTVANAVGAWTAIGRL